MLLRVWNGSKKAKGKMQNAKEKQRTASYRLSFFLLPLAPCQLLIACCQLPMLTS